MSIDPESIANESQELERAVVHETRLLRGRMDEISAENAELRKQLSFFNSARNTPIKPPTWTVKRKKASGHAGIVVAQMTDWHLDEVVKPEEVLFINAYDRKIAHLRMARWLEKVVALPRDYMTGIQIEGLVIPATGDLFTGDIHAELKESNEAKLLASLLYWMQPMLAVLEALEKEYPSVYVAAVVGNHGRLSTRPVFKGRVHDNVEWLFWSLVRDRLADRGSKVVVDVSASMDLNIPLYGRNHLLTHGDQFKGGSGISGALAPLSLGSHRKDKRQRIAGMPMETMVLGHLHQLLNLPGVKMGGTLKGADEFSFGHNFAPDPNGAGQAMWVTSPERAEVLWMPVYVTDREAEGW